MKNVAIAYNKNINGSKDVILKLQNILTKNNISSTIIDIDNLKSGFDFVFVIGGDGTILKSARFYSKFATPVFGINLGRLGFLSQVPEKDIKSALEKIFNNQYRVEDRIMLQSGNRVALNDFVIKGTTTGRTSKFSLKINDKFVFDYLADGIIISTPTGSTAYGLSAGGPVISPKLNSFVIVPICPHTLTSRPIVVPDSEIITVCAGTSDSEYFASTDGQEFYKFKTEIQIKKAEHNARLALLDNDEFYSVLRNKLHWGVPPTNFSH